MFLQSGRSLDWSRLNDEELWKAFREGQQQALSEVFLRYYTRLYRYGIKLMQNESAVQDGIQELFLKLWKRRETIDEAYSVEFYLLLSLRRILFRQKEQNHFIHRINSEYVREFSSSFESVEERMIMREREHERYESFQKALQTLTERQREILYLRLQHGMTNNEIAGILDLSLQRVKNTIYEVTKHLREQIYNQSAKEEHV